MIKTSYIAGKGTNRHLHDNQHSNNSSSEVLGIAQYLQALGSTGIGQVVLSVLVICWKVWYYVSRYWCDQYWPDI